jgi:nucleoside-diphosphate kinase
LASDSFAPFRRYASAGTFSKLTEFKRPRLRNKSGESVTCAHLGAGIYKSLGKVTKMAIEQTYSMIKPDGVRNGHIGEIVNRFERAGLKVERMELGMVTMEQAKANYAEHEGKPFYDGLISYITSGPVVKMVISGEGAVAKCRSLMGATNPAEAAPGTIRGDFGLIMDENVIHGSDSVASAEREIGIFF